jgi:predicted MPP superfamily phosphohydrolase
VRARFAVFVGLVQLTLFVAHRFVYDTWADFWGMPDPPGMISKPHLALALLSVSFVGASLLAFRYSHVLARAFYTMAAVWLGVFSFCFFAASSCWVLYAAIRLAGLHWERRPLAGVLFGLAVFASLYGIINASWLRVKRMTVRLPNLPESWRGRVAALVTDTHLGHVRGYGFARRIVTTLQRLRPDIVFIAGDLYDGTKADLDRLAAPWAELAAPLGAYFVTGNHEEFSDPTRFLDAVRRSGVRVLHNESVTIDGLQIIGARYRDAIHAQRFRSILHQAAVSHDRASVLLTHAPSQLSIAEEEAISLQLCGHTHGGQFFPFTWMTSRIYGEYTYGLKRFGKLMIYTSSGAGTWGPPMRVGTRPEIVLIGFE